MPKKVLILSAPTGDSWVHRLAYMPVKFNLLSIYSHLQNVGVDVDVLDLEAELSRPGSPADWKSFHAHAARLIAAREFDVAAVACYTSYAYKSCLELARLCRRANPQAFIVAGGYHPTSLPRDFEGGDFDAVITGEAELALERLAREKDGGARGLRVIAGSPLPLASTADLRLTEYPYARGRLPHYGVVLSRGCPFECEYCVEPGLGGGWRSYSVQDSLRLVDRIIAEHHPSCLSIHDPIFGFNRAWRREFLEALIRRDYSVSLNMETRVDLLEAEDLDLLGRLNMICHLGVESASERMLGVMHKTSSPKRYVDRLSELLEQGSRKGALFAVNLIFNHPGETPETMRETISFFENIVGRLPEVSFRFNPFLYGFYPGAPQFGRIEHYERAYGARVFWKEWWKGEPDQAHERATDVIASREMEAAHGRDNAYWRAAFEPIAREAMGKASPKLGLEIASAMKARGEAEAMVSAP